jgi:hypothetical protein
MKNQRLNSAGWECALRNWVNFSLGILSVKNINIMKLVSPKPMFDPQDMNRENWC